MSQDQERPHLHVEFFMDAQLSKRESTEKGRPIYKEVEKVRIKFAGDKQNVLVAPAHSTGQVRDAVTNRRLTYAEQFPDHYKAFQAKIEFHGTGTPIAELPFISVAKRRELEAANVFTAEALAGLDGSNLQKLGMGARELKNQAVAWLEKASGGAEISKLAGENEALRSQMEALQAQVAALMSGGKADEPAADVSSSPFYDWDDETIRLWIEEQGGEKPHHKLSHDNLVRKADELNDKITKQKAA